MRKTVQELQSLAPFFSYVFDVISNNGVGLKYTLPPQAVPLPLLRGGVSYIQAQPLVNSFHVVF